MKSLFINMAWDAAGCSYKQAEAIKMHTDCEVRHFRAVRTFYNTLDIGPENYNRDEFVELVRNADILHFCSATHTYLSPHNFGFDWNEMVKGKIKIFHDPPMQWVYYVNVIYLITFLLFVAINRF